MIAAYTQTRSILHIINIIHGVQGTQEQKQHNKARQRKTVQESHSLTLVTKCIQYEQIIYIIACKPLKQHQQTVSNHCKIVQQNG